MRERTTMNRERIQEKKKDKITWQVIIHSTFFFFDYSFLFHFLDDYFQLFQLKFHFDILLVLFLMTSFLSCIVNDNKERKGTQDLERNDETFWSVELMKQNEMIEEGRQIQKRKKEMKLRNKETNHKRIKYNLTSYLNHSTILWLFSLFHLISYLSNNFILSISLLSLLYLSFSS